MLGGLNTSHSDRQARSLITTAERKVSENITVKIQTFCDPTVCCCSRVIRFTREKLALNLNKMILMKIILFKFKANSTVQWTGSDNPQPHAFLKQCLKENILADHDTTVHNVYYLPPQKHKCANYSHVPRENNRRHNVEHGCTITISKCCYFLFYFV